MKKFSKMQNIFLAFSFHSAIILLYIVNFYNGVFIMSYPNISKIAPDFNSYANKLKTKIKEHIKNTGIELVSFEKNYYYVSGFLKKNNEFVYFSTSDYRNIFKNDKILIRTAKNKKDFTGGRNNFTSINDFGNNINKLFTEIC